MRYNPDTERATQLDAIAQQCRNAIQSVEVVREYQTKLPKPVWDCQKGFWTLVNA